MKGVRPCSFGYVVKRPRWLFQQQAGLKDGGDGGDSHPRQHGCKVLWRPTSDPYRTEGQLFSSR